MRVLMISRACLIGAYQSKLEELARHPDIDLMVVVPPTWRTGPDIAHLQRTYTRGYSLVTERLVFNGSFHLHLYPRLRRRLRTFSPDIVHIDEEPYNLATFQAMRLARDYGSRVLWFSWQNLKRQYPPPFSWIERYNLVHADYAIVGSQDAATVWRTKGYSGPLSVIPQFGVTSEVYCPRPDRPANSRRFVIGYAGRLVPEKGVDLLIEAVAGLRGPWQLLVVGNGPERLNLEQLAYELGVHDRVRFQSHVSSTHMPEIYRELDVLVLPSRSRSNWIEQFGRVLIEAMASGVTVVGSSCGEIPNVIGDAGLIFPEGDVQSLRDCLDRLITAPHLLSELGRRGRARVLAEFTQAKIAARTREVYIDMLERPPQSLY
ncbi:MAG: glycosyltransferase family 4 protein [Chloroflexi bacterium]|nr:glycosyltransferase family 4 protein [Chloroflexota bacterium]